MAGLGDAPMSHSGPVGVGESSVPLGSDAAQADNGAVGTVEMDANWKPGANVAEVISLAERNANQSEGADVSSSANEKRTSSPTDFEDAKHSSMMEHGSQVPVFASGNGSGIFGPNLVGAGAEDEQDKDEGGSDDSHNAQNFGQHSFVDASAIGETSLVDNGNHSNEHDFTMGSPQSGVGGTGHLRNSLSSGANMTSTPRLLPTTPHMTGTFVSEPSHPHPPTTNQMDSSLNASWMESQLVSPVSMAKGQFSLSNRSGRRSPTPYLRLGGTR
ncbi:hypothetical protein SARC_06958, partial [Sphaeroforma arctica JP610]